jgi:hypothetical protein
MVYMDNRLIDLLEYRGKDSKVFSGRNEGENLRKILKLDNEDKLDRTVVINIPTDSYSVNSGYFLGAFGDSVRALGREKFLLKYTFESGNTAILNGIPDDVNQALKTSYLGDFK